MGYFSKLYSIVSYKDADDVVVEKVFGSGCVVPDWRAPDIRLAPVWVGRHGTASATTDSHPYCGRKMWRV